MVLMCIFLKISDVDHLFISVSHQYVLFEEMSIQVLCPLLIGLFVFSGVELYQFFIKFGY